MQQLIDLTEIAEILHVSPERADELAEGVVFPPSVGDWGGERLWRRADVELWARAIPPNVWPERPQAQRRSTLPPGPLPKRASITTG
jgi:hypothetical protein